MTGWGHWNARSGGSANSTSAPILDNVVPGDLVNFYTFAFPNTTLTLTNTTHPITSGLPSSIFYGSGCCLEFNRHTLQSGDVSLGTPANALIYRENIGSGGGRSVYVGALHTASLTTYPSVQATPTR